MSKVYRINEFAKRIGRSAQTVRRWEREGRLTAKRLPSGQRYFDASDVRALLGGFPRKKAMVEDLMAIVHTFSCRLYGLRKYHKAIREAFPDYAIANPKAPCE